MTIERDDLTVQARDFNDNLTGGWRYLQEGEFERIAQAEGYVRVTEDCETCDGDGRTLNPNGLKPWVDTRDCPDCGGTGKKLRE